MLKYILAVLLITRVIALGRRTNITITGTVGCGRYSLSNVGIELYERDPFDPDDLLNRTKTDGHGHFSIFGNEKEIGKVDFFFRLKHNCKDGVITKKCHLVDRYAVPRRFYGKVYDMGIISLNIPTIYRRQLCDGRDD